MLGPLMELFASPIASLLTHEIHLKDKPCKIARIVAKPTMRPYFNAEHSRCNDDEDDDYDDDDDDFYIRFLNRFSISKIDDDCDNDLQRW